VRTAARLTLVLLRRTPDRTTLLLPVAAFAVATALTLTVLGGARWFFTVEGELAGLYRALAVLAVTLLVVPLLTLCGSAARLSTRRRDERLATLRLLGAPSRLVTTVTVLESTLLAAAGTVAGVVGHLLLAPVVGLLDFAGTRLGAGSVLLGAPGTLACVIVLVGTATVSALLGLRRVVVSPLGVRTRQDAPSTSWLRAVGFLAALAVGLAGGRALGTSADDAVVGAMIVVTFGVTLAILNLVGPWAVRLAARRRLRRLRGTGVAPALLATRAVLDDPKAAWRQVSGLAMSSFVAVLGGVGLALSGSVPDGGSAQDRMLLDDLRLGVVVTLVFSFVTVAASVAVNQAADVLDRRDLFVSLDRAGMPRNQLERSRVLAVRMPLLLVSCGSAAAAAVLVAPLSGMALVVNPTALAVVGAALATGIAVVLLAIRLTRPVLGRVLAGPAPSP
jgi:hypothetical protein